MDCQHYGFHMGNLQRFMTIQVKGNYPLDYFGSFRVHNSFFQIVRRFHITVWWGGVEMFALFLDFIAVQIFWLASQQYHLLMRFKTILLRLRAIHTVIDGDKLHALF